MSYDYYLSEKKTIITLKLKKKTKIMHLIRIKKNRKIVFHSFRRNMKREKYFLKNYIYMCDKFRYTQYFITRILPQRVYILLFR